MCGIAAFFARESSIDLKHLDTLFKWSEKRGQDGFGFVLIRPENGKRKIDLTFRDHRKYSECRNDVLRTLKQTGIEIGDLVIAISRAAPETEPATDPNKIDKTLQPIINEEEGVVVVHNGAVSNSILQTLKDEGNYEFNTDIDSEAIIASYIRHNRNIKDTFEFLSGGFAVILYDERKDTLYTINDFKPIAHGYVRGLGYFLASDDNAIGEIIQDITGCARDGVAMWETWYRHPLRGQRIQEIDLDSGFIRKINYSPRFITQKWDSNFNIPIKNETKFDEELCLVSASGGLDSSLTLAMLKLAGYKNIIACHFNYGHRGGDSEELAIKLVCDELQIPCQMFDLKDLLSNIDSTSMLIDSEAKITTGTKQGLKRLDAWVNLRNTQFLTWISTFAESQVMKYDYKGVYILGGFLNLSESGHYPDNSEYFIQSFLDHLKYGSLIGNRVKPLYGLSNLMKHELFILIDEFGLEDVYRHTISCDRPIIKAHCGYDLACNCMKNGIPACGSGLLSYWGSKMVGMDDMKLRNFYEVDDPDYEPHIPQHLKDGFTKNPNIHDIIDRILLPEDKLINLRKELKTAHKKERVHE